MSMSNSFKDFKERVKHRRALYRSLAQRGIIQGDPSLRSLDGSVYDTLLKLYQGGRDGVSPIALADICERCYQACKPIYEDETLTDRIPAGWNTFLDALNQTAQDPEQFGFYALEQSLEDGLERFSMELMAIEYPQS